jgi:polysaccharide biosynthesis/export protein
MNLKQLHARKRPALRAIVPFLALVACLSAVPSSEAQDQQRQRSSDLDRANASRVAASAEQVKAVLLQDTGLMVELKRWVAKDATDHGQIVSDDELTDEAIFDRIANDVEFRAIATLLVQHYGYLVPKVNPDSQMGQEQALLLQERVKWITQEESEERAAVRAKQQEALNKATSCAAAGRQSDCENQQRTLPAQGASQLPGGQGMQTGQPLVQPPLNYNSPENPMIPMAPISPFGPTGGALEQTQYLGAGSGLGGNSLTGGLLGAGDMSDSGDLSGGFGALGGLGAFGGLGASGGTDTENSSLLQQLGGGGSGGLFGGASSQMGGLGGDFSGGGFPASNSMLGAAMLGGGGLDYSETAPPAYLQTMSPAYPLGTPVIPYRALRQSAGQQAALQPAMARVANPYNDIPSLYDMYLQASPHPGTLRRFGSDVFENGIRDPQLIPTDLPAGPDYIVGPGDGLAIDTWGGSSRRLYRTVDREGRVSLPEVGPVLVSGKSLGDVQQEVQQAMRTQFRDVSADVTLSRLRTIRIYEVGDVANPGAYDISSLSTPLNALFAAGGPTSRGSLRVVRHYRNNQLIEEVDLYDLLLHGVKGNVERLENGDTILVPPMGPQVTVEGMVRRPAIYELHDEQNLDDVLTLAGGLLPTATLRHVEVQRLIAHDKQTMLSLDIPENGDDQAVNAKLASFKVQDGDRIRIFPIAPYNQNAIYLEGHVLRPGRYSYKDGMRVSDLIGSYKDLLPEPASQYAEIIRLNEPDFHPSVQSFDLADALGNPTVSPALQPMDTVRIFSRFDFENPPVVSVWGDVRTPGTYQTSGSVHIADAVHLAGGLAPDAATSDAQVFRSLSDGRLKIFNVNLADALSGVSSANIVLEPRDRLLIHRSPDAIQPAVVYIQGDVGRPGRYPLTTNMNVADLIAVGGGLKPSADTQSADLTRYEFTASGDAAKLDGQHQTIAIAAAVSGDPSANLPVHNGDVLTIRELPGWSDLGASIMLKGEVKHPGTYGIRPGERLSSVIERAGGFESSAYPYGSVLERTQVRDIESKQQDQMVARFKSEQSNLEQLPESTPEQKQAKEQALQQYRTTLAQLSTNEPVGRVAIRISSNVERWKNTSSDIEVRGGDTLIIPKQPSYVMVTGQVFNPTAVSYRPGKSAKWYLEQSGGPSPLANRKAIFVIRADGSVIGAKEGLWGGDSLGAALRPGDTVVVPEKAVGGGTNFQNLFTAAQVASSVATAAIIAIHY